MQNPLSTIVERRMFTNRVKNLDNLVCASCGSINIQIQAVLTYPHKNDQENQPALAIDLLTGNIIHGKQVGHQNMSNNIISFICTCSRCHNFSRFDVIQHKDECYVKTYQTETGIFEDIQS